MPKERDNHVETIEAGDKLFKIFWDDFGDAENPRDWTEPPDRLGTIYSLDRDYNQPYHRTDKWCTLHADAENAIEERFLGTVAEIENICSDLMEVFAEWSDDSDDDDDDNRFISPVQHIRISTCHDQLAVIVASLTPCWKGSDVLRSLNQALSSLSDLAKGYSVGDSTHDVLATAAMPSPFALLDSVTDILTMVDTTLDLDFNDHEDVQSFFDNFADELGWAWIELGSRGWMYATAGEISAYAKAIAGSPDEPTEEALADARKKAVECMKSDFEIYRLWRDGEVYGYATYWKDTGEDADDSCWGFYGTDDVESRVEELAAEARAEAAKADAAVDDHFRILAYVAKLNTPSNVFTLHKGDKTACDIARWYVEEFNRNCEGLRLGLARGAHGRHLGKPEVFAVNGDAPQPQSEARYLVSCKAAGVEPVLRWDDPRGREALVTLMGQPEYAALLKAAKRAIRRKRPQ